MHDFSRASEGFSGSSDSRRAPAQFVLRQPHRLIPAGGWRIVRSANAQLSPCLGRSFRILRLASCSGGVRVTTTLPPDPVRSADARLFPCLGRIRKSVPDPRTRVVLLRSSCYDNPTAGSRRRVGAPFVPLTHDFSHATEGFVRAFRIHRLPSCSGGVGVTTTHPYGLGGGLAKHSFRRGTTFTVLWKDSGQSSGPTDLAFRCTRDGLPMTRPYNHGGGVGETFVPKRNDIHRVWKDSELSSGPIDLAF
ncbi:hypothetical protein TNCT_175851 [Trichonephila clavata]|uniref:Uncharacterized protein n=1 Tax=Trichonephila clavata TaxID=2740835 RepID=A0A8X6GFD1_TRICU|nr:hypothetical protein TNCT_175851 [Trichonephila clavata]